MRRAVAVTALLGALAGGIALGKPAARVAPSPAVIAAGQRAFVDIVRVLQSPRCVNCHPAGDRPLQGDHATPHAQDISRRTVAAGVPCTTCHQDRNSEAIGVAGGPPGAPKWGLPPADMPMVFQNRTATQICEAMKDPARNHGKSLAQLLEHASSDPIVLWGWNPGGARTLPPLSHDQFAALFQTWVESDGACPP